MIIQANITTGRDRNAFTLHTKQEQTKQQRERFYRATLKFHLLKSRINVLLKHKYGTNASTHIGNTRIFSIWPRHTDNECISTIVDHRGRPQDHKQIYVDE